jgi:hypothetical protein
MRLRRATWTCAICGHRGATLWCEWDETRWVAACEPCQREVSLDDGDHGGFLVTDLDLASQAVAVARRIPGLTSTEIGEHVGIFYGNGRDEEDVRNQESICQGLSRALRDGYILAEEAFCTQAIDGMSSSRRYYPSSKPWMPWGFCRTLKMIKRAEKSALREIEREQRSSR